MNNGLEEPKRAGFSVPANKTCYKSLNATVIVVQETLASHGAGGRVQSEIPRHMKPLPDLSFVILLAISPPPQFIANKLSSKCFPSKKRGFLVW